MENSMQDTIIGALRTFFLACPLMGKNKLNVDYLPADCKKNGIEYSIDTTPATEIIKRYTNGFTRRQYLFVISSVNDYGNGTLQNIASSGFYEKLSDWLEAQTKSGVLPLLPDGKTADSIEAQTTGYLFSVSPNSGKYQIQCRLVYTQKG
ncbi:MAG: hypothetical protein RR825_07550 [Ruthenibacterium sp.]